jgi:hypothetical protein
MAIKIARHSNFLSMKLTTRLISKYYLRGAFLNMLPSSFAKGGIIK